MKQTIGFYEFRKAFESLRPDNFSYEGLSLLWDYFEQYEEDTGEEIELDVIAICCEYSEDTPEEIAQSYDIDLKDVDEDDIAQTVMDWLCDHTTVCGETDFGRVVYCSCF